jgi:hypothetical protein
MPESLSSAQFNGIASRREFLCRSGMGFASLGLAGLLG